MGFLHGGLILDEGYTQGVSVDAESRPLVAQSVRLADEWRIVLITPSQCQQVCGEHEAQVMAQLGSTANPQRAEMMALAKRALTLASAPHNFDSFVESLDQYMQLAASLFSPYQAGMYNGPEVAAAVELARSVGLRAVGQSSWGPTVFGFAANIALAQNCAQQLQRRNPDWSVALCTPAEQGAQYRISDVEAANRL